MGEITATGVNSSREQDISMPLDLALNKYMGSGKKISRLESSEERVALLKAGFKGKEIESLYLHINNITVIGINWSN